MKIVFIGDISVSAPFPGRNAPSDALRTADVVIGNLEGPLLAPRKIVRPSSPVLYNTPDVIDVLKTLNVQAVSLANNHMFDVPGTLAYTKQALMTCGISSFGAGNNRGEAGLPFVYRHGTNTIKVFAFGWDVIGCRYAGNSSEGVNPATPANMLATIKSLREKDNESFVVYILHWNYELERYPQPAHRQLAHDLVSEGVDAIVGLHPHVVQGAERVNDKPIVYSLGNWFFPPRKLGPIWLRFPPSSHRELALCINFEGRRATEVLFNWHAFDPLQNRIIPQECEGWDGPVLKALTPFAGLSHHAYVQWFIRMRARRKGLPVYGNYRHVLRNFIKDCWVKARQSFITFLIYAGLKGGPRQ